MHRDAARASELLQDTSGFAPEDSAVLARYARKDLANAPLRITERIVIRYSEAIQR